MTFLVMIIFLGLAVDRCLKTWQFHCCFRFYYLFLFLTTTDLFTTSWWIL